MPLSNQSGGNSIDLTDSVAVSEILKKVPSKAMLIECFIGSTYTIWGKRNCPPKNGTDTVYSGNYTFL